MQFNSMMAGNDRRRPRGLGQDFEDYAPRKKVIGERPVDYFSSAITHVKSRPYCPHPHAYHVPPHPYYCKDLLPPRETPFNPSTAFTTQWVHTSFHPDTRSGGSFRRRVVYTALKWAPNGRRLLTATGTGEFLLYNGHAFGMEVKTIAHDDNRPCKSLEWGRINDIILSGDERGVIKIWLPNFVLVSHFDTNQKALREFSWSPGEHKFATAGQDGTARIWDTHRAGTAGGGSVEEESKLEGHGSDVHTIDWHPFKALILTGSQDRDVRLWDPRSGDTSSIVTLHGHTQPIVNVKWQRNGNTFLSASRDCTIRLWDMRKMKEIVNFQGHTKDVTRIRWHPTHDDLFASCGNDGLVAFWVVAPEEGQTRSDGVKEVSYVTAITAAHDKFKEVPNPVNDIAFSPMGNLLATCSGEVKYWHRNKPGTMDERTRGEDPDELAGEY